MSGRQQAGPNSSKLLAYLQLVRLPALFTALADIFLGFLLTHEDLQPWSHFGFLLSASALLYLSGMVFNDLFDRKVDAQQRPNRPIPSGRISLMAATGLGVLLMSAGIGAATLVGTQSAMVAVLIAAAVLAYDGLLKSTAVGPIAMGLCRFLNVMLGASAVVSDRFDDLWRTPQLYVAGALGIFIVGVTWFARSEAAVSRRSQLAGGMAVVNLGIMLLMAFIVRDEGLGDQASVLLLLALTTLVINRRLSGVLFDPEPWKVQLAVKTMLLSLPMIDASIILHVSGTAIYALTVAVLVVPAMVLSRWIPMT